MDRLSDQEISAELENVAWQRDGEAIVLDRKFTDFAEAMEFVNLVATEAEKANHHPNILVHGWNGVRLTLYTHTVDGLTAADFAMARTIDKLAQVQQSEGPRVA